MPLSPATYTRISQLVDQIEEAFIATLLGLMTLITFINVITRYVFNGNILWAQEATTFFFAWLVLIGISYCVKKNAHLGVDVFVNLLPLRYRFPVTVLALVAALTYAILLTIGAWQFWLPFFGERAWYETNDIPVPELLQLLAPVLNEGERWSKLPRFIPYFALPLGMSLLTLRLFQVSWRILTGQQRYIIASPASDEAAANSSQPPNPTTHSVDAKDV